MVVTKPLASATTTSDSEFAHDSEFSYDSDIYLDTDVDSGRHIDLQSCAGLDPAVAVNLAGQSSSRKNLRSYSCTASSAGVDSGDGGCPSMGESGTTYVRLSRSVAGVRSHAGLDSPSSSSCQETPSPRCCSHSSSAGREGKHYRLSLTRRNVQNDNAESEGDLANMYRFDPETVESLRSNVSFAELSEHIHEAVEAAKLRRQRIAGGGVTSSMTESRISAPMAPCDGVSAQLMHNACAVGNNHPCIARRIAAARLDAHRRHRLSLANARKAAIG